MPKAGINYLEAGYYNEDSGVLLDLLPYDNFGMSGEQNSYKSKGTGFKTSFEYGFFDQLALGIDLGFVTKDTTTHESLIQSGVNQPSSSLDAPTTNKGLENIGVNSRFRLLDISPYAIDLLLGGNFKLGKNKTSSSYTDNNGKKTSEDGNGFSQNYYNAKILLGSDDSESWGWRLRLSYLKILKGEEISLKADSSTGTNQDLTTHNDAASSLGWGINVDFHFFSFFVLGLGYSIESLSKQVQSYRIATSPNMVNATTGEAHKVRTINGNIKIVFGPNIMLRYDLDLSTPDPYKLTTFIESITTSYNTQVSTNTRNMLSMAIAF